MTPSHACRLLVGGGEVLTGGTGLLSYGNTSSGLPTLETEREGSTGCCISASGVWNLRSQRTRQACLQTYCTETGRAHARPSAIHGRPGRGRYSRKSDMNASGQSDGGIVTMKQMNRCVQPHKKGQQQAESLERSLSDKGGAG